MFYRGGIYFMVNDSNFKSFFAHRLYTLRTEHNISAREMSLAIGQNSSYINRIENKITLPSMQCVGKFYTGIEKFLRCNF